MLTASVQTLSAQSLAFRDEEIDMGLTQWYHPITATYIFTNVSEQPVSIQYVDPGCGCMEPEWTREVIQPGATGRVVITYNAEMLGRFDRLIEVKNSIDGEPQLVRMKCKVVEHEVAQQKQQLDGEEDSLEQDKSAVDTTPGAIDYEKPLLITSTSSLMMGKFKPNKKLKGTVTITNRGDEILLVDRVETSAAVIADCEKLALKKGQTFKIKVWVDTAKMAGAGDVQQITIISNDQLNSHKSIKILFP